MAEEIKVNSEKPTPEKKSEKKKSFFAKFSLHSFFLSFFRFLLTKKNIFAIIIKPLGVFFYG